MRKLIGLILLAWVSVVLTAPAIAAPVGTAITYQGELQEGGVPADGEYDFEFRLFDVDNGGTEIVSPISVENLQVSAGIFTVELDFTGGPYSGDQLWLQVSVRPGASIGGFTQLLPRQKITATPFALHAQMVAMSAIGSSEIADGSIGAADVKSSEVQYRVTGTCAAGSSIRTISDTGTVTCEDDSGMDYADIYCPPEQVMIGFQANGQPACEPASSVAGNCPLDVRIELVSRGQVDFIILADNSGSMVGELEAMESNLNAMATTLDALQSDYRFIMVNDHGAETLEMCIPTPLSGTTNCAGAAVSGPRFFHYDVNVLSHDSLCIALDALTGSEVDEFGRFGTGYQSLLRPSAFKAFIELSDDGISCTSSELGLLFNDLNTSGGGETVANNYAAALTAFAPSQFGEPDNPRFAWYGIIGVPTNGSPTTPYIDSDAVVTSTCVGGVDPGTGYQWLAKNSNGLWFSQCETASYGSMLDQIAVAANDLAGGSSSCTYSPVVPAGRVLDQSTADLVWSPSSMGSPFALTQVANVGECAGDDYYFEGNGDLTLCPAICSTVQADADGLLNLEIDCEWPP